MNYFWSRQYLGSPQKAMSQCFLQEFGGGGAKSHKRGEQCVGRLRQGLGSCLYFGSSAANGRPLNSLNSKAARQSSSTSSIKPPDCKRHSATQRIQGWRGGEEIGTIVTFLVSEISFSKLLNLWTVSKVTGYQRSLLCSWLLCTGGFQFHRWSVKLQA